MITKKVNRYYCEFCKKANCCAFSISRHEKLCTLNPNRVCGVCKMDHGEYSQNEAEQKPINELLAILPDPTLSEGDLTVAVNKALPELRKASGNCPACIMAALRQKGISVPMATDFDFKSEMQEIWSNINDANFQKDYSFCNMEDKQKICRVPGVSGGKWRHNKNSAGRFFQGKRDTGCHLYRSRGENMKKPKTSKDLIPALDLLQTRLERGEYLAKQDGLWHLFDEAGEGVASGKDLRNILINLIWIDC